MKNDKKILLSRAKEISYREIIEESQVSTITVVEFLLTPEIYAIESSFVSEVLPLKDMTTIPGAPAFVIGVFNVRGKIVSIVNLKTFFNLKEKGITELNKIIVLNHNQIEFGIVVDEITGSRTLNASAILPPPATISNLGNEYIKGVTSEGIIILDIQHILLSKTILVNQKESKQ